MLTDDILREATAEAERFRLSIVPEDGEPHVFSKRFERKMEKLIRRANHPIRYQVLRAAAAVVLVIATLFGAVMAISPEARAAVVGWIKETFGAYVHYENDQVRENHDAASHNSTPKAIKDEYHLAVAPEGYREIEVVDKLDGKAYVYVNDVGEILRFVYTYGRLGHDLFIDVENYEKRACLVNGCPADIYIAFNESESNVIIWQQADTTVLFRIQAFLDRSELIEIAEIVTKITQ